MCGVMRCMCIVDCDSRLAGMALYMLSLSYELNGALPRALECAREALHIWKTSLPPSHENVAGAISLVRSLEQATR